MDIYDSRYYKTNIFYLKLLGLWPFDDFLNKRVRRILIIIAVVSLIIPQVIRLFEEWGRDIDIVIEVIGSLIYFSGCQIKYLSFLRVEAKMKYLYNKIAEHWKSLSSKDEIKTLEEYGEIGRGLTLGYIIPINIILVIYISLPLLPLLLDVIDPQNETRPKQFPYFAEYFIDDQKYYFELTIHGWIVCILSVQIYGTFDTTYTQCVQHACGLFGIVEQRLRKATKLASSNAFSTQEEKDEKVYDKVIDAILLHKEAIQFVNLIEDCYSFSYFFVVTLNTAVVSLAAVDTMLNLENGNTKQMVRIGALYIGFSFHLLYNMSPGQRVIDSSTNIQNAAFHCDWFNASSKTKTLIRIIMLRSLTPCQFTAGKLIVLHLESFAFVFKNSISYVTVVGSMR
ncbi:odorant receptor 154 [Nasonia vitripennis]|uniref:Odorant receptor n=1 Tax=Nasonia vitripennis TaxID=7425 RepID=A0A7M6UDB7_NASVI|nr:odorant receptor 154 [Nasonia vitripennis]